MPINPNSLKEPFDVADIDRMIDSWRGQPAKSVPVTVKAMAKLMEALKHAASENRFLSFKLKAQDELIAMAHREFGRWNQMVEDQMRTIETSDRATQQVA